MVRGGVKPTSPHKTNQLTTPHGAEYLVLGTRVLSSVRPLTPCDTLPENRANRAKCSMNAYLDGMVVVVVLVAAEVTMKEKEERGRIT